VPTKTASRPRALLSEAHHKFPSQSACRYDGRFDWMMRVPTYQRGDYVKIEFEGENGLPGEWMWMRVHHCDDEKQFVFGTLDNGPVYDYGKEVKLGSELAIGYSQIREHKTGAEFRSIN
jgi:hypothetical protein